MKILVIRFSSIGDIVLTTPVLRLLQTKWEGTVEVHFLTKKQFVPLLKANPNLDKIHALEGHVKTIIPALKSEAYDVIIDLHNNLRSLHVKKALGVPAHAFQKLNFQKWFYVNTKINVMPDVHIVDRYVDTLKSFGIENDNKGLDYFIPTEDEVAVGDVFPQLKEQSYIGFVIGGSYPAKMLPEHLLLALCKKLNPAFVLLLGGPEDQPKGERIAALLPNRVFNAAGKFSINQSASLVKQANVVIAHDTGLMHIAAAFKKKVISIWGATVPQFGMYPYLPGKGSVEVEPKGVWDRPYTKLGNRPFYKPKFKGMERINLDEIVCAIRD